MSTSDENGELYCNFQTGGKQKGNDVTFDLNDKKYFVMIAAGGVSSGNGKYSKLSIITVLKNHPAGFSKQGILFRDQGLFFKLINQALRADKLTLHFYVPEANFIAALE